MEILTDTTAKITQSKPKSLCKSKETAPELDKKAGNTREEATDDQEERDNEKEEEIDTE
jgi:hypothetical protein